MVASGAMLASLRRAPLRLLDLLLPPRCAGCGGGVAETGALCSNCWAAIEFLAPPACRRCAYPFEFDMPGQELCAACSTRPPVFDRARAVLRYDAGSRGMLLAFKHADRTDLAPLFGRWLARAGGELLAEADLVAPVPLHWTRLWARRYNQSAMLARWAAAEAGRPFLPDALVRRKRTPPQRAGRAARARNVAGAFGVPAHRRTAVEGRRVRRSNDGGDAGGLCPGAEGLGCGGGGRADPCPGGAPPGHGCPATFAPVPYVTNVLRHAKYFMTERRQAACVGEPGDGQG
jgi:predicted amidophosphoribosyltransferase